MESIARLRAHGVPGTWHVGPSVRPADIGARLIAHGFTYAGDDIGMAADLSRLPSDLNTAPGLTITRVHNDADLEIWTRTLAVGFGEGEREAAWTGEMYRRIGEGDAQPWRHYLGWLSGAPVATASLFLGAGVAGIYFVFSVPDARRQGIGAAITRGAARCHRAGVSDRRAGCFRDGPLGLSAPGLPGILPDRHLRMAYTFGYLNLFTIFNAPFCTPKPPEYAAPGYRHRLRRQPGNLLLIGR